MMVLTQCPQCARKTPVRINNSPQYWYCRYCKAHLSLKTLTQLSSPQIKDRVKKEFPEATHYIDVEGEPQEGGPVVIDVPVLSKATDSVPSRPQRYELVIFAKGAAQDKKLGEIFLKDKP